MKIRSTLETGLLSLGLALGTAAPAWAGDGPYTLWNQPAGYTIPSATETNLGTTAGLFWLDLRNGTNVALALTCYGVTDGTSSNLCRLTFAPSVDRLVWDSNLCSLKLFTLQTTNYVPGTYCTFTTVTNTQLGPYPYYRLIAVSNMTAKLMSNSTLRYWTFGTR